MLLGEHKEQDTSADQMALVAGIKRLLEAAEKGELRGLCYARVNGEETLSFGFFGTSDCGVHELLSVSHLLNVKLLEGRAARSRASGANR